MNLVFDFGGVVFDWRPQALLARVLPSRAATPDAALHWAHEVFRAGGEWHAFDRGALEVPELIERVAARTGLERAEVGAIVDAVPAALEPRADTVALLHRLRDDGHRLYFLSNMPAPFALHLERSHAFLDCFADGVFSARVRMAKPDAEIFELAQRRFGIASAADCILLDDHPPNVEAARALGWRALHFTDAAAADAALRAGL